MAWANRTGVIDARLVTAGNPVALPPDVAHTLFRIAQEALTNAIRHARASSVRVGLVYAPTGVRSGAGRRRGLRSIAVEPTERQGFGLAGWPSAPGCWAGPWNSTRPPAGARGSARRSPVPSGASTPARARAGPRAGPRRRRHAVTRAGIVRLLSAADPALHVVGEAGSGAQAIEAWRALPSRRRPHGPADARRRRIEAIARIRAEDPTANIVR